ncbi:hypothetical protein DSO57_1034281 [Entomophthora muscae]|uniref:Uncharacterized protein n=1 Tax=Entomophthora muscae TaxID=34485 RepID=A0ACC2SP50_9FUNG|nr:hypothetical protein DSO57_1034281 [Entomophthora muscae]
MFHYLRTASVASFKLQASRTLFTRPAIFKASAAEPKEETVNWDLAYLNNPTHKVVGDVVDEHLASEAAAAAKYTRVVSSGGAQVHITN